MLETSQANALVYSTLCGFMLVGLFAGYKVRNTTDFLSGLRTQSGKCHKIHKQPRVRSRLTLFSLYDHG